MLAYFKSHISPPMPRRSTHRQRYRKKRYRAARTIQRLFRRRRTYRNRAAKTSNVQIGRRPRHLTLRRRVARLEISSKKHYDYMLSRPNGVPIAPHGAENGTVTNESFSQMLAIQPRNGDGTIPPVSGSARGTERNTREGMELFCTKVRLRGRILGIRPNDTDEVKNCSYPVFNAQPTPPGPVVLWNMPFMRANSIRPACQSRVHLIVLRDSRPSTIDPATGLYEPNPLPVQPMNVLQGLFLTEGLTTTNSLESLGMDSALRNYTNNRFKIVHQSVLQFDFLHPSKWFDISINVNKKLVYQPPNPALVPQGNSDPVNYNLLFYVSSVPSEVAHAQSAEFVMTDLTPIPPLPPVSVNLLLQPNLQMLSSRTYFRES